jgi:glycosyltransferase involved in cell wall biosynthesis
VTSRDEAPNATTARGQDGGRPKRLGLLVPGFSSSEEDWCIPALLDLVRALAETDDVTVFALRYPPRSERYRLAGAEVIPFGGDRGGVAGRALRYRRAVRTIVAEHRARPFDLLHAFWAHEPGAIGALAASRTGVPLLVSVLGGELAHLPEIRYGGGEGPLNRHLVRFALSRAHVVTAGSRGLLADAARRLGPDRLELAPLGVERGRFFPAQGTTSLEGNPALLTVGSLVPVKGHSILVEAFARVASRRAGAVLHVVGEGPERDAIESLSRARGLGDRVRLHGAVPHDALPPLYRGARLLVLSSLFESQCLAALEALACGTPVAGTAVGILPEIVPAPLLAAPGDPAALAQAIEAALSLDAAERAEVGRLPDRLSLAASVTRWRELHARL